MNRTPEETKKVVQETYGSIASKASTASCSQVATAFGYSAEELSSLPEGANLGLSCGNPLALASLKEGETVVDLGSGAGIDCFLAAKRVGTSGKVIGVDMTPAMIEKARKNAEKTSAKNVEFRLGEIEALPVEDNSVDCVISNCVINLVPDKAKAFREIYRVLKPGGRLAISDIAFKSDLPAAVKDDVQLLTGCISGALPIDEMKRLLLVAGFSAIDILDTGADLNVYKGGDTLKPGDAKVPSSTASTTCGCTCGAACSCGPNCACPKTAASATKPATAVSTTCGCTCGAACSCGPNCACPKTAASSTKPATAVSTTCGCTCGAACSCGPNCACPKTAASATKPVTAVSTTCGCTCGAACSCGPNCACPKTAASATKPVTAVSTTCGCTCGAACSCGPNCACPKTAASSTKPATAVSTTCGCTCGAACSCGPNCACPKTAASSTKPATAVSTKPAVGEESCCGSGGGCGGEPEVEEESCCGSGGGCGGVISSNIDLNQYAMSVKMFALKPK